MNKSDIKILIVDDDIDYLFQARLYIENFGYKAITAESQKECEGLLGKIEFDLAIIDLMMENEDSGFILCYKIKKMFPNKPIIIATAVSSEAGISFGLGTNEEKKWIKADAYLDKGIRPDQLHREIVKLLKL